MTANRLTQSHILIRGTLDSRCKRGINTIVLVSYASHFARSAYIRWPNLSPDRQINGHICGVTEVSLHSLDCLEDIRMKCVRVQSISFVFAAELWFLCVRVWVTLRSAPWLFIISLTKQSLTRTKHRDDQVREYAIFSHNFSWNFTYTVTGKMPKPKLTHLGYKPHRITKAIWTDQNKYNEKG